MTSIEQADKMANAAAEWDGNPKLAKHILYTLPLVELIEVASAAKDVCNSHREHEMPCMCSDCCLFDALETLQSKGVEL